MALDPRIVLGLQTPDISALQQGAQGALQSAGQIQQLQQSAAAMEQFRRQEKDVLEAREFQSKIRPFIGKDPVKALENIKNSTVLDDDDKVQITNAINAFAQGNQAPLKALDDLSNRALGAVGGKPTGGRVFAGEIDGQRGFFQTDASGQTVRVTDAEGRPITPPESQAAITFRAKQLEAEQKKEERVRKKREQAVIVSSDISDALNLSEGFSTTGFVGAFTSDVPGTPGFNLKEKLKGIKANVGFNKLQDMRAASPTGGALGQVSDKENALLQSVFGSLEQSQSKNQLQGNLNRLDVLFNAIVHGTQPIPFNQSDFDSLPSGATYISPDTGTIHRKP